MIVRPFNIWKLAMQLWCKESLNYIRGIFPPTLQLNSYSTLLNILNRAAHCPVFNFLLIEL